MTLPLTTNEMFSGIGGFRLGLEKNGWQTLWANDNNKYACHIYKKHFGTNEIVEADIKTVNPNTSQRNRILRKTIKRDSKMKITNPKKLAKPERSVIEDWLAFCKREDLNVIPCIYQEKTPAIGTWLPYQTQQSTDQERNEWFLTGTPRNLAVVCGAISNNLVVIDFDDLKQFKRLFKSPEGLSNETLVIQTGKGYHVYYKLAYTPPNMKITHFGIDIKGEGGYVLFPPSIHPTTKKPYVTISNLSQIKIKHFDGDITEWLLEKCVKADKKFNPEDIRQPISIENLLQPQGEGTRNDATIKLATWYRLKKHTEEETQQKLAEWNKNNTPPINPQELETIIHSAYKRKTPYHYHYIEDPLETEEFTQEIKEAAEKLSQQQNIIPFILKAQETIVGEEKNKVTTTLLNLVKESIQISGESASGKNTLVDTVLTCFPKDTWFKATGASAKVLRFLKEVGTLYFAELGAFKGQGKQAQEETITEYDIKVAISEGKLSTLMTVKEEGEWGYKEIETKIGNFIMTTTDVDIPPELKNRIWELNTDTSQQHIKNILEADATQKETISNKRINREKEQKTLRYLFKQIQKETPKEYVIPYAKLLLPIFRLIPRANRDKNKLWKAIQASAILHYKTRPIIENNIICTPQDFINAWTYMDEAITGTFSGKTKRFKEIWQTAQNIIKANKTLDTDTLSQILEIQPDVARRWIKRFVAEGLGTLKNYPKSKSYYFQPTQQNNKTETIEIKLKDLYSRMTQWLISMGLTLNDYPTIENEIKCNRDKSIIFRKSQSDSRIMDLPNAQWEIDGESDDTHPTTHSYPTVEEKADWFNEQKEKEEQH